MRDLGWRGCQLLLVAVLCLSETGGATEPDGSPGARAAQSRRLNALIDSEWEWRLKQQPTFASYLGDRRYNDRWPDVSLAAITSRHEHRRDVLKQLDTIDPKVLSASDRLN